MCSQQANEWRQEGREEVLKEMYIGVFQLLCEKGMTDVTARQTVVKKFGPLAGVAISE
jgi:hypothetical protein